MSALVAVVGNSGVGKTTLVRRLHEAGGFTLGLEQHAERPFQRPFASDLARYALPNQVDYLLLRAEQELAMRIPSGIGLIDGGLDFDFHVFSKFFPNRGYLSPSEFDLCARLYALLRSLLPPPELIVRLVAPLEVVAERYARRERRLEIARLGDLPALERLLDEWLEAQAQSPVLPVEVSQDDPGFADVLPKLIEKIRTLDFDV